MGEIRKLLNRLFGHFLHNWQYGKFKFSTYTELDTKKCQECGKEQWLSVDYSGWSDHDRWVSPEEYKEITHGYLD